MHTYLEIFFCSFISYHANPWSNLLRCFRNLSWQYSHPFQEPSSSSLPFTSPSLSTIVDLRRLQRLQRCLWLWLRYHQTLTSHLLYSLSCCCSFWYVERKVLFSFLFFWVIRNDSSDFYSVTWNMHFFKKTWNMQLWVNTYWVPREEY